MFAKRAVLATIVLMSGVALATDLDAPIPTVDCTGSNAACPEIKIEGWQPPRMANGEISFFRGMADPVLRSEPDGKTIWLAYSWPSFGLFPSAPGSTKLGAAVDIHYARSDDSGNTWHDMGLLWPSVAENDVTTGTPGRSFSEVANLARYEKEGKEGWFGARYAYLIPADKKTSKVRGPTNSRIVIYRADTVPDLANAPSAIIGGYMTDPEWGVDYDFSKLSPEVAPCAAFGEPALRVEHHQLYIALRCFEPSATEYDTPIMVFSAPLKDDVHKLKWQFRGTLASSKEAKELGIPRARAFTEVELATGRDGKTLAILMPDYGNDPKTAEDIHFGCRVFEVPSLDHPSLARDANGKLIIRAVVTASDEPDGSSSCAYDAASATGILVARKERYLDASPPLQLLTLNITGLRP